MKFITIIVIPSVIIWCFGIPLAALIILLRKKDLFFKEDKNLDMTEAE